MREKLQALSDVVWCRCRQAYIDPKTHYCETPGDYDARPVRTICPDPGEPDVCSWPVHIHPASQPTSH